MMEITSELSDNVVMQSKYTMQIYFIKILATGLLVAKTLIKYIIIIARRKMMKKRRIQLILSL